MELGDYISQFDAERNLLLMDDANIDLKSISSYKYSYLEILSEHGLMCGISGFTRIETKLKIVTKSWIDRIFARFHILIPSSAALDIVLADHRAIIFTCSDEAVPKHNIHTVFFVCEQLCTSRKTSITAT